MKLIKIIAIVSAATATLLGSSQALAWGQDGHRVTGQIAADMIRPETRVKLNEILPGVSLADISTWMDEERKEIGRQLPGSSHWHYDNIPVCSNQPARCEGGNCATEQIERMKKILGDRSASRDTRLFALKAVVHMVGDIHQPMHAADDHDFGGNDIEVGRTNLHSLWDTGFVKKAMRGYSVTEYSSAITRKYQLSSVQGGNARSWAAESHEAAVKVAYGQLPGFACGQKMAPLSRLPAEYENVAVQTVEVQLAKAGARIAYVLDQALSR